MFLAAACRWVGPMITTRTSQVSGGTALRKLGLLVGAGVAVTALTTGTAAGAAGGNDRPYKISGSGIGTIDAAQGTFTVDGMEQASHLGRSRLHADGVFTSATTLVFTATVVAASGDTLTLSGTGVLTSGTTSTNVDTITGGTGRFSGATGRFTEASTLAFNATDPSIVSITFTGTGTISY